MSTEWYTREYELHTREYELHTREYELYTLEYWIKLESKFGSCAMVPTSDSNDCLHIL